MSAIGVDTEADSFHSYREKTCLIQISTRDQDYLIDPLTLPNLDALKSVFADRSVLKVFHAADNDVAGLKRDFGLETHSLFDTMLSARILGLPRVGLADLLREFFGVETNKRLQRYAWGGRPLDASAQEYAAMDSHYLLPLRDILIDQLTASGRLDEAEEEFERLERAEATVRVFDPEGFWRMKGVYDLTPDQRAVLRELFSWRDRQASASNRPPFRIAPDHVLLILATKKPRDLDSGQRNSDLPQSILQRFRNGISSAIRRGLDADPPQAPRAERRDDAVVARYETLRKWRRETATQRGVDPDVILSNAALLEIATQVPQTVEDLRALEILGPWKLRAYGRALLYALSLADP